jgi:thiamine-monophosphate kinase
MLNRLHVDKVFKNKAISSIILPKPKLKLGVSLGQKKLLTSSIDSSDGLSMSLYEIVNQNHVGIEILNLPVDKEVLMFAKTNKLDFKELVLYGGEEYEIVGTIPKTKINYAQKIAKEIGENIYIIGKIVDRPSEVYMIEKGRRIKIEKKGWVHLAK